MSRELMHVEPCEAGVIVRVHGHASKRFAQHGGPVFNPQWFYLQSFNSGLTTKRAWMLLESISIYTIIYRHVGSHSIYPVKESDI